MLTLNSSNTLKNIVVNRPIKLINIASEILNSSESIGTVLIIIRPASKTILLQKVL